MRLFLLMLCLFSLITVKAQKTDYSVSSIPGELLEYANAVVRSDQLEAELVSSDEMNLELKLVVTVFNKLGNRHVKSQVGYDNGVKVKAIEAIIYDSSGAVIDKKKEKDFKDISAVDGATLYSDSRIKYLEYTPREYPYTVEFRYRITAKNTAFIPSWYFLDDFLVSVESSVYRISWNDPGLKPKFLKVNCDKYDVKIHEGEDALEFKAENLKALKNEILAPSFVKMAPKIFVRPTTFTYEGIEGKVETWEDLGSWMHSNLLENRSDLTEKTKAEIKSLVDGVIDPIEKAKIVYKYVQDNTRYISVQVGIGGIQPISAMEVDKVKYGDCKGLANYTKALLAVVGVESYYVHVESGSTKIDFYEDFPDLSQGNHVILAIPFDNTYYWIDCTSKTNPFGFLGDFTDDRTVFVIKENGGELVKTPSYLNEQNKQQIKAVYSILDNGEIDGEVNIRSYGIQYENRYFLENEDADDIHRFYKRFWNEINNLQIGQYTFKNLKESVAFEEQVKIKATDYFTKSNDRIFFTPNAFNKNTYVPKRYRNRTTQFEISRGFFDEDEYQIELPEGYRVEAIPENRAITTEFGSYMVRFTYNKDEKSLNYYRSLQLNADTYSQEQYESYRKFRKEIAAMDNAQIVLIQL